MGGAVEEVRETSPTEDLRTLLDEAGVAYEKCNRYVTLWRTGGITWVSHDDVLDGMHLSVFTSELLTTPEGAIDATVGFGAAHHETCRNIAQLNNPKVAGYYFVCSECGLAVDACFGIDRTEYRRRDDGTTDYRTFHPDGTYEFERCPHCGRLVVE